VMLQASVVAALGVSPFANLGCWRRCLSAPDLLPALWRRSCRQRPRCRLGQPELLPTSMQVLPGRQSMLPAAGG
jgi:hypothetical protein